MTMDSLSPAAARHLWIGLMTLASTITTLALACATPFPALAALAALHVRRQDGIILMLAAWAVSQGVGYCLLGYETTVENGVWAGTMALAAIASLLGADGAARLLPHHPAVRLVVAYGAAFATFKLAVLAGAWALDSGWAAFAPDVMARQFARYAMILAGLLALQHLADRSGLLRRAATA
ncbi:hypothetical protein SBA_ch2_6450 [Sphingomonas bisphenolicum]|uniref:Transmembrane protein n=2 Tax=Sphingomonas bisphenolicum TaxID=296544 RepID=A0ABM7G4H2_9SPHN|nr:hypothetical protein SBA_ch2_6450 [Sphingomonas bisphenolicum]